MHSERQEKGAFAAVFICSSAAAVRACRACVGLLQPLTESLLDSTAAGGGIGCDAAAYHASESRMSQVHALAVRTDLLLHLNAARLWS